MQYLLGRWSAIVQGDRRQLPACPRACEHERIAKPLLLVLTAVGVALGSHAHRSCSHEPRNAVSKMPRTGFGHPPTWFAARAPLKILAATLRRVHHDSVGNRPKRAARRSPASRDPCEFFFNASSAHSQHCRTNPRSCAMVHPLRDLPHTQCRVFYAYAWRKANS